MFGTPPCPWLGGSKGKRVVERPGWSTAADITAARKQRGREGAASFPVTSQDPSSCQACWLTANQLGPQTQFPSKNAAYEALGITGYKLDINQTSSFKTL